MDKRDQDLGTDPTWTEGAVLILEGSMNVCVLVNLESVYAFTSGLLSLPVEEEEGDLTVYSYVL